MIDNDTTRSYPRTAAEAFKGPDYAQGFEPPERTRFKLTAYELGVLFSLACLAIGMYFGGTT